MHYFLSAPDLLPFRLKYLYAWRWQRILCLCSASSTSRATPGATAAFAVNTASTRHDVLWSGIWVVGQRFNELPSA